MNDLIIAIGIMAFITYLIRVIPLVLMKKEIKSCFFKSFLYYMPYTVLAAMTFPAIIYATGNVIVGIIGSIVGIAVAYLGKSLLQTSLITVATVYLLNILI